MAMNEKHLPEEGAERTSSAHASGRLPKELAELFSEHIRSGKWLTGKKIPSIRRLAVDYRVAPTTVCAALRRLRESGLVSSRRGSGVYVNTLDRIVRADLPGENAVSGNRPVAEREPLLHFLFHIDSPQRAENSPLYTEVLCLMQEEVERVGWRLRIGNAARIREILSGSTPLNTVGAIYMPDIIHPYDLDWPDLRIPRVLFSIGEKNFDSSCVTPDNYCGGYIAARLLAKHREKVMVFTAVSSPETHLGFKPYRDRIQGATDFRVAAGLGTPEVREVEAPATLVPVFEELMTLPRSKRPGIILNGTISWTRIAEGFNLAFPGADLDTEFQVVEFADFMVPCRPRHAIVSFSRRVLCREVVELIRRLGENPLDQPIMVKIPMKITLPEA